MILYLHKFKSPPKLLTLAASALLLPLAFSFLINPVNSQSESALDREQSRLESLKREYWHALRREHVAKEEEIERMRQEAEEEEQIFHKSMERQWQNAAYRIHIGEFDSLPCPDGSHIQAEILKHDVRKPSWNVREEHIVTRHKIISNGKPRYVLADSFIRFTIYQRNRMQVQVVKRNFDDTGRLENQVSMSGILEREKKQ